LTTTSPTGLLFIGHRASTCIHVDLQRTICIKLGDQLIIELKTITTQPEHSGSRSDLHTRIR
jgi:hypothetical protein